MARDGPNPILASVFVTFGRVRISDIFFIWLTTFSCAQDVENMYQNISEANAVASLLTSLVDAEEVETCVIASTGERQPFYKLFTFL